MKKLFAVLLLSGMCAGYLHAWGALGHRIIAEVAYNQLTKKARKQLDALLGKRGVIYYAPWADEIKSDTIYSKSHVHHYQNLKAGLKAEDIEYLWLNNKTEGEYAFYAIDSLVNVLKTDKNNVDALKFTIHILADLFQPMHLGHPDDKGGNRVQMRWFGHGTNLHSVWDRWLLDYAQLSQTEYVRLLEDKYSWQMKEIQKRSMVECLCRTYELQNAVYDWQEKGDNSNYHYAYRFRADMEQNMYAASVKLAQLLNEIYK